MNCHRLSSLLSAYIDGELTGVEMIEIRDHLSGCPACQDDLDQVRAVKRMVGRLRTAQPAADFAARICGSLNEVKPYSFLGTWVDMWQSAFKRLSPAMAMTSLVVLGMVAFGALSMDEKIAVSTNLPEVAVSRPVTALPASFSGSEPNYLERIIAREPAHSSPNRWIVPASYVVR